MSTRFAVIAAVSLVALTFAGQASADEKGTVTMKITTIVGKPTRPSVVVEIARAKPEIKLSNLQDPAVEKAVRAAAGAKTPL
jgi:hypothetical protein